MLHKYNCHFWRVLNVRDDFCEDFKKNAGILASNHPPGLHGNL